MHCICQNYQASCLVDLSNFPLTNTYHNETPISKNLFVDASLSQCTCGHVLLSSNLKASDIYHDEYAYNSKSSVVADRRAHGISLITQVFKAQVPYCIYDVGCGQLQMLTDLADIYQNARLIGIDPVPLIQDGSQYNSRIKYINNYFHKSMVSGNEKKEKNLFIFDNVLEHISDVRSFVRDVVSSSFAGDIFYVCVPSFDLMKMKFLYQEIILEHLHYFTLNEMSSLFFDNGCKQLSGYALMINGRPYNFHVFEKTSQSFSLSIQSSKHEIDGNRGNMYNLNSSIDLFKTMLSTTVQVIDNIDGPIYGVCAAETTPVLAYFMCSSFDFCSAILDTTNHKVNKYMPGVKSIIQDMGVHNVNPDNWYFITAPNLSHQVQVNLRKRNAINFLLPINTL